MSLIVCRFLLRHEYFASQCLECFELLPGAATAKLMQQYGLLMRQNREAFELICQNQAVEQLLSYLSQQYLGQKLEWYLSGDLNHFFEISEIATQQCARFLLELPDEADLINHANSTSCMNLSVCAIAPDELPRNSLALLRCDFSQLLQAHLAGRSYQLDFPARKLHWVYYLINRSQVSLQQARITCRDVVGFADPLHVTLETGEQALKFSALSESYPLKQSNQPVFDLQVAASLIAEGQPKYRTLIKGLPTPKPGRLSLKRNAEYPVICSEMFVYL